MEVSDDMMAETYGRSSNSAKLRVEGVSLEFPGSDGRAMKVLNGIDLAIAPGEFCTIVGPSGCGKSTMLRLLAGLDTPDAGEMTLGSQAINGPSSAVGVVFQNATLLPWMTVWQNVILPLQVGGGNRAAREDAVREYLSIAGLAGFENKYPYELSGGMQQRAAIVRGLARDPKVLLMDEPFGALDAQTRLRVQSDFLRALENSGRSVVMITHDLQEAILLGDRILVMSSPRGAILADRAVHIEADRSGRLHELVVTDEFRTLYHDLVEIVMSGFTEVPGAPRGASS